MFILPGYNHTKNEEQQELAIRSTSSLLCTVSQGKKNKKNRIFLVKAICKMLCLKEQEKNWGTLYLWC